MMLGFQVDVLCQYGFTYQFYARNNQSPEMYPKKGRSFLHSRTDDAWLSGQYIMPIWFHIPSLCEERLSAREVPQERSIDFQSRKRALFYSTRQTYHQCPVYNLYNSVVSYKAAQNCPNKVMCHGVTRLLIKQISPFATIGSHR